MSGYLEIFTLPLIFIKGFSFKVFITDPDQMTAACYNLIAIWIGIRVSNKGWVRATNLHPSQNNKTLLTKGVQKYREGKSIITKQKRLR